ncbi:MAG: hypothetical protein EOP02_12410 [Proteobacteria bacterium]|nr:MAG: hypothetical protein EOP02_12410 [Pseudomonadota bacterium]
MSAEQRTLAAAEHERRWQAFTARPLQNVHRARLQACFDNLDLPAATLDAMLAQPLLQPLEALQPPQGEDVPIATLDTAQSKRLARRCGVVFWAEALVREIRAPAVRALRERFGDALLELALAEQALACPLAPGELAASLDELDTAVERDGQACVNAWLAEQPRALAAWYRLKIDDPAAAAPITARIEQYGPAIVRRVVRSDSPIQGAPDE